MRKNRIPTPELQRRRLLYGRLQALGISLEDLADLSGLDASTFSKALWNEYPADDTLGIVKRAIKAQEKKIKARRPPRHQFI